MKELRIVGLDLGGTNIKAVLVDEQGELRSKVIIPTEASQGPDHVISRMAEAAKLVCQQSKMSLSDVLGIGIGSPGPLDIREGLIVRSANLPGWDHVALRDRLRSLTQRPTVLLNDATAAAYGEDWVGAGQRAEHMCLLTLGTGVGGGVICRGEILQGYYGNAGELGHMIVVPDGEPCRCGQRGCLEVYASSSYMVPKIQTLAKTGESPALARKQGSNGQLGMPELVAAAESGDDAALGVWDKACWAIALAIVTLQHSFNPKYVLLGGGISAAGDKLLDRVTNHFERMTWELDSDRPSIRLASLGNDAGAIGAAGWFLHLHERGVV